MKIYSGEVKRVAVLTQRRSRLRAKCIAALLGLSVLSTGCVVTQTRGGQIQFGIDADAVLGTKVRAFETVQGPAVVRRNTDGSYGLRLERKLKVLRLGRHDDLQVVTVTQGQDNTAILLRTISGSIGCPAYRLVNVSRQGVGDVRLPNNCKEVDFEERDGQLAMRQRVDNRARWWHWDEGRFNTSVESAQPTRSSRPARVAESNRSATAGQPAQPLPQSAWRPQANPTPRTQRAVAPSLPPAPPRSQQQSVPVVRVNLVDDERS